MDSSHPPYDSFETFRGESAYSVGGLCVSRFAASACSHAGAILDVAGILDLIASLGADLDFLDVRIRRERGQDFGFPQVVESQPRELGHAQLAKQFEQRFAIVGAAILDMFERVMRGDPANRVRVPTVSC